MGKSETALEVAKVFNAEIVNGDAFQIYKEMDIGVSKPPKEYFNIPHHLYSFVSPSESYSIKEYQKDARRVIDDILSRNKNVIIVGGSGLYIRSALYDYEFNDAEAVDMSKYEAMDNETLHKELEKIDPADAMKIHPNNRRRVLRSIQIYLENGESKSDIISKQNHEPIYKNTLFVMPNFDREELYERINKRVDIMMDKGLLKEAKHIYDNYPDSQAIMGIGYKEFIPYFEGHSSLEDVKEEIKKDTRNYAKRQITFFTRQFEVESFDSFENLLEIING